MGVSEWAGAAKSWAGANRIAAGIIAVLLALALLGAVGSVSGRLEARRILKEAEEKTEALKAAEERAEKWATESERFEEALYAAQERERIALRRLEQARGRARAGTPRPADAAELEARLKALGFRGRVRR